MKALKIILGVLTLIVMVIIIIGLFLPSELTVSRTTTINAPYSSIHAQVNNFRNWSNWTAWAKQDTNITNTYEGPETGAGSIYKWSGNEALGKGMITMTQSDTGKGVWYDMSMEDGQFLSKGSITYDSMGDSTMVTWSYQADTGGNIIFKFVMVFFKPYIEHDFDEGLQGLKILVESDSSLANFKDSPPDINENH
jgi:hypothetical protein